MLDWYDRRPVAAAVAAEARPRPARRGRLHIQEEWTLGELPAVDGDGKTILFRPTYPARLTHLLPVPTLELVDPAAVVLCV